MFVVLARLCVCVCVCTSLHEKKTGMCVLVCVWFLHTVFMCFGGEMEREMRKNGMQEG